MTIMLTKKETQKLNEVGSVEIRRGNYDLLVEVVDWNNNIFDITVINPFTAVIKYVDSSNNVFEMIK